VCGCVCMAANEIDVLCADLIVLAFIVLAFVFLILTVVIFVLPFGVIKNNNSQKVEDVFGSYFFRVDGIWAKEEVVRF